jgi:hypothetical protein
MIILGLPWIMRCELEVYSNKITTNNYLNIEIKERCQWVEQTCKWMLISTKKIEDLNEN